MTKLRSGQRKRDDADSDADADAADQSNTYMSSFQATQKLDKDTTKLFLKKTLAGKTNFIKNVKKWS